ncbi:DUF6804 family protein [Flammeovirga pacifica]|uniref:Uncharacterized protein n=1 Tax=Flammeovirga pacifica TaxID=915059 RepID=A0A1S1YVQ7_FLAPC|nr:DUF6804 family protein [Flammeovirga pacifica]OHX65109.1 hypothetical protein NH26_01445 [Flammeovirga pacifica]
MRNLFLASSIALFVAMAPMPSGYYTLVRILISISAIVCLLEEYGKTSSLNLKAVFFLVVLIFFNPIFPIYLHDRGIWAPIDIIGGIVFGVRGLNTPKS